jgi:hypothetical protein
MRPTIEAGAAGDLERLGIVRAALFFASEEPWGWGGARKAR